jgi:uncharacterized protein
MSEVTLESYLKQLLESHRTPEVTVAWQGGEPTLMGLDFFRRAVELVEAHRRPGQVVEHTSQTNGILLDDDWCAFFKEQDFLVGVSVNGPERSVYRFLRDELAATWIQFIPIVERATPDTLATANRGWREEPGEKRFLDTKTGNQVTERTLGGEEYGQFLVGVFEEWVRRDVGRVNLVLQTCRSVAFPQEDFTGLHDDDCHPRGRQMGKVGEKGIHLCDSVFLAG